jgi:hypothetical protein
MSEGCALEVFVTDANRYALKYPVEGLNLKDNLDQLATEFDYRDSYALVSEETLSPTNRDKLLSLGLIIPYQDKFKYTHGIDLTKVRQLIGAEALEPGRK